MCMDLNDRCWLSSCISHHSIQLCLCLLPWQHSLLIQKKPKWIENFWAWFLLSWCMRSPFGQQDIMRDYSIRWTLCRVEPQYQKKTQAMSKGMMGENSCCGNSSRERNYSLYKAFTKYHLQRRVVYEIKGKLQMY